MNLPLKEEILGSHFYVVNIIIGVWWHASPLQAVERITPLLL
jgi:hypothetical protein